MMPPGLAHALIGAAICASVGLPLALASVPGAPFIGLAAAAGFYVGRERRQSEERAGSNRLAPWVWAPRALRDTWWPALAAAVVAAALTLI
jgi:hypothetical protein